MKIAYFNCSSGISGDMCLGALADAGVPLKRLEKELRKIPIKGWSLALRDVRRGGLAAKKVDVILKTEVSHAGRPVRTQADSPGRAGAGSQKSEARRWKDVEKIIKTSKLPDRTRQKGIRIFRRLFEAEAKVHGESFNKVHLHELGATDCIIDILGTIICLDILGVKEVYSSPLNLGGGSVKTAHGILPVPAPATAEIIRRNVKDAGCRIFSDGTDFELTTPTGAAIINEIASGFGQMPQMTVENIGIGAGGRDLKGKPNVLSIFIGQSAERKTQGTDNKVTVIETNIDDMNPQVYEYAIERLFKAGALDVYLTQVLMKKGRPGIKLTAICGAGTRERLMMLILRETTSIGLRFYEADRKTLDREIRESETELGRIRFKVSRLGGKIIRVTPEYEDCRRLAKKLNMPLVEVMRRAITKQCKPR